MILAVIDGDYDEVKNLINTGCDVDMICKRCQISYSITKESPWPGATALMQAAALNDTKIMELLLDEGADPDLKAGKMSALAIAANLGNYDAAKLLVQNDADVDLITENDNFTSLHYLASPNIEKYKINHKTLLRNYLKTLDKDERERKLEKYQDDLRDHNYGIKKDYSLNLDLAELLLKNSSEVNIKDKTGQTPLMLLIRSMNPESTECVKLFIKYGADISLENDDRETVFTIAEKYGHKNIVKLLEATDKKTWVKE